MIDDSENRQAELSRDSIYLAPFALSLTPTAFLNWMDLDLEYIDQWSLFLDFSILARTVPAVLRGSGAS